MDSSTEQLVRDYLNRLAVAARQSLSPGELMSFIARMRSAIERQVGPHGAATPTEVATMLAALGAPEGLVELEQQRLAAAQTDRGRAAVRPVRPVQSVQSVQSVRPVRAIEPPVMLPTARNATAATDPRIPAVPPGADRPGPDRSSPDRSHPDQARPAAGPATASPAAAGGAAAGAAAAGAAKAGSSGSPDGSLAFIAEPVTGPQGSVALARFSQDLPPTPPPAWPPLARSPDARARPEPGRRLRLRPRTPSGPPARPRLGAGRASGDQPAREQGGPAGREPGYEPVWGTGDAAGHRDEPVRVTADAAGQGTEGQPVWGVGDAGQGSGDEPVWGAGDTAGQGSADAPVRGSGDAAGQGSEDQPVWGSGSAGGQGTEDQPVWGSGRVGGQDAEVQPVWGSGSAGSQDAEDEPVWRSASAGGQGPQDEPPWGSGEAGGQGSEDQPVWGRRDAAAPEQDDGPAAEDSGGLGPGPTGVPAPETIAPDPVEPPGPEPEVMPGLVTGYRPDPAPAPQTGPGPAQNPESVPARRPESVPAPRREPLRREPVRPGPRPERGSRSDLEIVPGLSDRPRRTEPGTGSGPARRPMRALPPGVRGQRPVSASDAARRVWLTARRQPLEATAIVVMVLGVLIFPPLWLVGVFVALLSRFWDLRDKLVALAGPALLTVIGTGVGLATGTTHSSAGAYVREAGALSTDLLTTGAILGAVFLSWRLARGRRQESTPPWMRTPHH